MKKKAMSQAEIEAIEDAMREVDPDASDQAIAEVLADYLLSTLAHSRAFHLSTYHDVRPSAPARLARVWKFNPDYQPHEPVGPCPFPYDWSRKNIVGISTRDRERARQWIIEAALAGYAVFRGFRRLGGAGFGQGSLENIRARRRANYAREIARAARV